MRIACLLALSLAAAACRPDAETPAAAPEAAAPAVPPDPDNPDTFVGLLLTEAQAAADQAGVPHRVVERDGEALPRTMDFRPERLNFAVVDGKVVKVTKG